MSHQASPDRDPVATGPASPTTDALPGAFVARVMASVAVKPPPSAPRSFLEAVRERALRDAIAAVIVASHLAIHGRRLPTAVRAQALALVAVVALLTGTGATLAATAAFEVAAPVIGPGRTHGHDESVQIAPATPTPPAAVDRSPATAGPIKAVDVIPSGTGDPGTVDLVDPDEADGQAGDDDGRPTAKPTAKPGDDGDADAADRDDHESGGADGADTDASDDHDDAKSGSGDDGAATNDDEADGRDHEGGDGTDGPERTQEPDGGGSGGDGDADRSDDGDHTTGGGDPDTESGGD